MFNPLNFKRILIILFKSIIFFFQKYSNNITSIPDADIASLNSILLGFSASELAQLVFTTTDGISALGTLTGWSADQVKILTYFCLQFNVNIF